MTEMYRFLHVQGAKIVDANQQAIVLRGVCLGGWLNMENFIIGYPANESLFRSELDKVLGIEKTRFFFDQFYDHFITEVDIEFIKNMGANVIRLPINYRHFEDDHCPGQFLDIGFRYIDRVLGWCKKHGLYLILDLHAAQGWQNPDWHCDNPDQITLLWEHTVYQDRVCAWWKYVAAHYTDDPYIAGYDLINEPVLSDIAVLYGFYRKLISAIREVDQHHILFVEGNFYSTQFEGLRGLDDANIVFSSHHYMGPAVSTAKVLKRVSKKDLRTHSIRHEYATKNSPIRDLGLPVWIGEFGLIFEKNKSDDIRLNMTRKLLLFMNECNDHWTYWTYKDIGLMGVVTIDSKSPWMKQTKKGRALKTSLASDTWPIDLTEMDQHLSPIEENVALILKLTEEKRQQFAWHLKRSVRGVLFGKWMMPLYVQQFANLEEDDIMNLMTSFSFEKCHVRKSLTKVLSAAMIGS